MLLLIALSAISLGFIKMEQENVVQRLNNAGTGFRAAIASKIASYSYLIGLKNENDRLLETNIALIGGYSPLKTPFEMKPTVPESSARKQKV